MGKLFDLDDYRATSEALKAYLDKLIADSTVSVIQKKSFNDFPSVGAEDCIYIDQSQERAYRWDSEAIKYQCIGSNYEEIKIIKCGDSSV